MEMRRGTSADVKDVRLWVGSTMRAFQVGQHCQGHRGLLCASGPLEELSAQSFKWLGMIKGNNGQLYFHLSE